MHYINGATRLAERMLFVGIEMTHGNYTVKRYGITKNRKEEKWPIICMIECKTFQTNKITHDLNAESNISKSRVFHCLIYFKHYPLMPQWKPKV